MITPNRYEYINNYANITIEESYNFYSKITLESKLISIKNFNIKNLNFNFKNNNFCNITYIDYIQFNFFFNLNYNYQQLFNIDLIQKKSIETFYLNHFSSKYYIFNLKKDRRTYNFTLLYSLLTDSDFIFYDNINFFDSEHNIFYFFKIIIYLEMFKDIHNKIENMLLYTEKGNILLDYLSKFINHESFDYHNIDFMFQKEKIEDEQFYKILLTYKELKHIKLNLEGF